MSPRVKESEVKRLQPTKPKKLRRPLSLQRPRKRSKRQTQGRDNQKSKLTWSSLSSPDNHRLLLRMMTMMIVMIHLTQM